MGDHERTRTAIEPAPTADEAAAIGAALAAYLADRRAAGASPAPPNYPWAVAGRLASQGGRYERGRPVGWGTVNRVVE